VSFSRFDLGSTPAGQDGVNVITFRDDAAARSIVGDLIAITSFFFIVSSNTIVESDILFNPDPRDGEGRFIPFSTTGAPGTFDIESTLAHEMGHAIGAKHSSVAGSTMWQNGRDGETFSRTLAADDQMFAIQAYPENGALSRYGRIRGVARSPSGAPIRGGLATAAAPYGEVVSALTDLATGEYEILVPPGDYYVYLDPANEPLGPAGLVLDPSLIDNSFGTTLFGGNDAPTTVAVSAGATATADLTAPAGDPPLEIRYVGVVEGDFIVIGTGPRELPIEADTDLYLWGPGLDQVEERDVRILGREAVLASDRTGISPIMFQGFPALRITVRTLRLDRTVRSSLGTILITRQGAAAAYTGGIVIENKTVPPPAPTFSGEHVTNAASYAPGPVAPGELISIFGLHMGPENYTSATRPVLDESGRLPTELDDVQVTFDGVPAPLFYVSAVQINLQVPYEVEGRAATAVVVSYEDRSSESIDLPVAPSAPGVFLPGGILNQDGSPNSQEHPEARGRAVVIFATGQGAVSPPLPTGQIAPASPLSGVSDVSATISERPAQVLFAGLSPGFVGLLQVNVLIPDDAPAGLDVPLEITIRGRSIQDGVTVAIAP
jgi:uncharacterized protein (TIGR03437 family)